MDSPAVQSDQSAEWNRTILLPKFSDNVQSGNGSTLPGAFSSRGLLTTAVVGVNGGNVSSANFNGTTPRRRATTSTSRLPVFCNQPKFGLLKVCSSQARCQLRNRVRRQPVTARAGNSGRIKAEPSKISAGHGFRPALRTINPAPPADLVRLPSEDQKIIHAVGFHEILRFAQFVDAGVPLALANQKWTDRQCKECWSCVGPAVLRNQTGHEPAPTPTPTDRPLTLRPARAI